MKPTHVNLALFASSRTMKGHHNVSLREQREKFGFVKQRTRDMKLAVSLMKQSIEMVVRPSPNVCKRTHDFRRARLNRPAMRGYEEAAVYVRQVTNLNAEVPTVPVPSFEDLLVASGLHSPPLHAATSLALRATQNLLCRCANAANASFATSKAFSASET